MKEIKFELSQVTCYQLTETYKHCYFSCRIHQMNIKKHKILENVGLEFLLKKDHEKSML
jgi:hypothetical protein